MKKSVFSVNISDTESKRKVLKSAASLSGIDSLSIDLEKKQLTVVGTVDQVKVIRKLGKKFNPRILTVGLDKKEGFERIPKSSHLEERASEDHAYWSGYESEREAGIMLCEAKRTSTVTSTTWTWPSLKMITLEHITDILTFGNNSFRTTVENS
ncbi:hypothetical protein MLD38_020943 [Melastoma candidum]|uniref:Uncharacterized protein n=1 Tax=Melastoma candidum TaxID=119954 RepID=A0ACB9QHH8_9MYRT|nr:hypothetical protein MLD38_020943 [Melastoma candidum]